MSTREIGNILREARAKIATPETWWSHGGSVDRDGQTVADDDASAARWCAFAALLSLPDGLEGEATLIDAALSELDDAGYEITELSPDDPEGMVDIASPVELLNDELGHAAVMVMYDRAIAWHTSQGGQP